MEMSGKLHALVTLAPVKSSTSTQWIGGSVGPRASLNTGERENLVHLESNPGHSVCSPSLQQCTKKFAQEPISTYSRESIEKMSLNHGISRHIFKNTSLTYHGGMLYKHFHPEEGDCMFHLYDITSLKIIIFTS
jgi:hypothetical protein